MLTHTHDTQRFAGKVRQIRGRVPAVLARWGLRSRFARWRLTQDPSTGLVVLFGVLNKEYIAAHPTTPFNDYFDPSVLLDLSNDLTLPVVSSDSEDFWYAFILDRGQLGQLPAPEDLSSLDANEPIARVWDESGVGEDMTNLDRPNEHHEDYQALADFQWTLKDTQVIPAPPIKTASGPHHAKPWFRRRRRIPHGTGSSRG